ncbi:hypothetical protein HYV83_05465 [Candidatus Woesearchaeota archaeon]|nr:hypothetical protein [Candidatus Woesearchaeota archaeon]
MENPKNPLDAFLEEIDLSGIGGSSNAPTKPLEDAVRPQQTQTKQERVKVYMTKADYGDSAEYFINCVSLELEKPRDGDIPGKFVGRELYLKVKNLGEIASQLEFLLAMCEYVEDAFEGIKNHRNPPMPPTDGQAFVSYRLVNSTNDPKGDSLYMIMSLEVMPVLEQLFAK